MKTILFLTALLTSVSAFGGDDRTPFKAGAYRGTMLITTSIEGVGETSATLKIRGRSAGDLRLDFMGGPQLDLPLFDREAIPSYPVKRFTIARGGEAWEFTEYQSAGFSAGSILEAPTIKGNTVKVDLSYFRNLGTEIVTITLKIHLTRVGN